MAQIKQNKTHVLCNGVVVHRGESLEHFVVRWEEKRPQGLKRRRHLLFKQGKSGCVLVVLDKAALKIRRRLLSIQDVETEDIK